MSKALIDSVISHDKFLVINNMLKEHEEMKEEIKNLITKWVAAGISCEIKGEVESMIKGQLKCTI